MSEPIGGTNTSIFDSDVKRDESIPINDLLSQMKKSENEVKSTSKEETKPEVTTPIHEVQETTKPEKELSPLEQLKMEKEKAGAGMVVSNSELEEGKEKAPSTDMVYTEERIENFNKAIDDLDDQTKKRNAVILIKKPETDADFVECTLEIDSVVFDENGKAHFEYKDEQGNDLPLKFCRLREEGEDYFDYSSVNMEKPTQQDEATKSEDSNSDEDDEEISEEKKKVVQVIMDKTGLGVDFVFSDEEKQKLEEAETIRVNEVKLIDIAAVKAKRSQKSFQDSIKEFNYSGSRASICFPASGYKAQLKGMTYGEYADVALSMENITFDQYYKRLSIIYNKMTNISSGPFKDFEDFLKHTAYTDISLALYGLFLATESDEQEIPLKCGATTCGKSFNWKYNSRSLLRLDKCADTFLTKMEELATAPAMDYTKIKENSAVENSKYIELPESKIIVEMGIASAYDFLYNFIPLMDENTFREAFGDDENDLYKSNLLLLTSVRSVYVPDGNGEFIECIGYKDILEALYNISPKEIKIITAYTAKLQGEYEMTFALKDVVCPHCKNVTKNLEVSMDDLIFQTYSLLMSTDIDLNNIQDL